uniref:Magnesium transporter CorA-like family protein n=1 Tax=Tanacetum cinerariifolium TaxID=118510 RepID=A0A6L2J3X1_TANCI|nr:magnesium transporter CorA-like family protein [Tanacetum cinerariifolium]
MAAYGWKVRTSPRRVDPGAPDSGPLLTGSSLLAALSKAREDDERHQESRGDICASMNDMKKNNNQKHQAAKDATVGCTLWTDGLICAFEAKLRVNGCWETEYREFEIDDNEVTVADIAVPYRERPVGPTWWCHVEAGHPSVHSWLSYSKWLHPAISIALRDESKLISERMKHLLYEVPVRVAGGLLFELLGQSAGDPYIEEDDIPVVLRSWQAQNFLVTALHVKGSATNVNVLGVSEVQELLAAGGSNLPQTIHEVIALLACRLARWDDRLFRKYIIGAAAEVELKFMNRRNQEDLHLFSIILNQEIRRLSSQVLSWPGQMS